MGNWAIVVPETAERTNLVINPSAETAVTGYTATGTKAVRLLSNARRGGYVIAVTPSSGTATGVYYGTVSLTTGVSYTFSVDVLGVLGVPYRIYFADTSGNVLGTPTTFTGTGDWQRVTATYTETSTTTRRLYIVKNNSASTGDYYVDGLMVTAQTYELEYFDGDSPGARWESQAHNSKSISDPQWRHGGRVYNLDSYSVDVRAEMGIGMPAAEHLTMSQALLPGALFQGKKELPRTVSLLCQIKGSDWDGLHSLRKDLIDAIKPDLVGDDQPFILRYYGANSSKPLDLFVTYDSGLEMGNPDMYLDEFELRMIAYDPFWYETGGNSTEIVDGYYIDTYSYFAAKINKSWSAITPSAVTDPGAGIRVRAICIASRANRPMWWDWPVGKIYVGGLFLNWDGLAAADYIAMYDPETPGWAALGSGTNGYVRAIVEAPDGSIYAGGEFTLAGGVADTAYIAKWDGSVWTPLGTGMNGNVYGLAIGPDGYLYATGAFTTANGVSCARVAKWNGTTFEAFGAGLDGDGVDITFDGAGNLYVCGIFTHADSVDCNRIAKWNGTTFEALGTGFDGVCYEIEFGPDGLLYAVGAFASADGSAADAAAYWNGSAWFPMGAGLVGGTAYSLAIDEDGLVYAGGAFTSAGGVALADRLAVWNGSTWAHADINLPGSATLYEIIAGGGDLYLGFDTTGSATHSKATTVTNGSGGTRTAYPQVVLRRSGGTSAVVQYLRNDTTGKTIWLNYSLQDGESLVLDFSPGERSVKSSYYGKVWRAVLRGSDIGEFGLLPGANQISLFVDPGGSPTLYNYLQWIPAYWSADGAAV